MLLGLLIVLPASQAALAQTETSSDPRIQLQPLLDELDSDFAQLAELKSKMSDSEIAYRETLEFRLDDRALRLLRRADELASRMAGLPLEDPLVTELRERVVSDFEQVGDAVLARLRELDGMILEQLDILPDKSGSDRIAVEAYILSLDALRERYLASMARHITVREQLGLSNEQLRPKVRDRLLLRAETLAGNVRLAASTLEQLRARTGNTAEQQDLEAVMARGKDEWARSLDELRAVTRIMDGMGMDTSEYKSLLVSQKGISMQFFEWNVVVQLLDEWVENIVRFLGSRIPDLLINLVLFVLILVLFRYLARLTRNAVAAVLTRAKADTSVLLRNTVVSLAGGGVMLFGFLLALSQLGFTLGPMLAGLGIAGFIVGFALQDTLANFASGAMILIYRPYDVDDFVEVTGVSGMVKKMSLVSTTITTFDNQTLVVPNSKIWGDVIKNVTKQEIRRVDLQFGISYADDIAKTERILAEAAAEHPLVLGNPETMVKVHSLGDSSVNLILRPWVKTADYWTVYWDLTRDVKLRFDREGVTIPFPQRDVHLIREGDSGPS